MIAENFILLLIWAVCMGSGIWLAFLLTSKKSECEHQMKTQGSEDAYVKNATNLKNGEATNDHPNQRRD